MNTISKHINNFVIFIHKLELQTSLVVLMLNLDISCFENSVDPGQDQLKLIMKHISFYGGCDHFGQVALNNLMNTPSNSPVISEEKMFR